MRGAGQGEDAGQPRDAQAGEGRGVELTALGELAERVGDRTTGLLGPRERGRHDVHAVDARDPLGHALRRPLRLRDAALAEARVGAAVAALDEAQASGRGPATPAEALKTVATTLITTAGGAAALRADLWRRARIQQSARVGTPIAAVPAKNRP